MPSTEEYDPTGIEFFSIPSFKFTSGHTSSIQIAYRSYNPSSTTGTVLIPTCYGGKINSTLNFTTGCLSSYHVIVVAMLSNGESSSPSTSPSFPPGDWLRYEDCINAQYLLVTQHFGLKSLEAVIGFSMGGQQAYYWAVMHGSGAEPFVKNAVVLCSSAKTSRHNYAFVEGPIAALMESADYADGRYKEKGVKPIRGLRAFGRAYAAWLTSYEWFEQELWREWGRSSLVEYLHPPAGEGGWEEWDAEDVLIGARMWQAGDVGAVAGEGDWRKALEGVTARMLVMPGQTDQYFTAEAGEKEAKYLKNGIFEAIPSIWGHVAGGGGNDPDTKWVDERIGRFLAGTGQKFEGVDFRYVEP